jgi:hypothetical protein
MCSGQETRVLSSCAVPEFRGNPPTLAFALVPRCGRCAQKANDVLPLSDHKRLEAGTPMRSVHCVRELELRLVDLFSWAMH